MNVSRALAEELDGIHPALGVLAATAAGTFRCPAEFWAGVTKEQGLASCGFIISAEGLGGI